MYTVTIWHLNCTQVMLGEGQRMEVAITVLVSVLPEVWGQWLMYGAHWPLEGSVCQMVCPEVVCS